MKYSSLREYFYKLHNLLYGIMLVPLLALVVLYWQLREGNITGVLKGDEPVTQLLLAMLGFVVVVNWVVSFFLFNKEIKAIRKLDSLGKKIDRYFFFTLLRFSLIASASLGLAVGFYLTENQVFTILVVVNFVGLLPFWPTTAKVCNDLKLRGDERTLVLYKMDRL